MTEIGVRHRLGSVSIDEGSLAPASPEQEHERKVAIADLLKSNSFEPEGGQGGPYALVLGLVEGRLPMDITGPGFAQRHQLSMSPFRRIIRDYFIVCDSYY